MFKTLLKINVNKQFEILKSLMYITPQPNNIKNLTKALLRLQFLFSNKDNRKKSIKMSHITIEVFVEVANIYDFPKRCSVL